MPCIRCQTWFPVTRFWGYCRNMNVMGRLLGKSGVLADHRVLTRFDEHCTDYKEGPFRGETKQLTPDNLFLLGEEYVDPEELFPMDITFVVRRKL
jgi:hypothetical protein